MDEPQKVPDGSATPPAKQAKPLWETVLTTTPIVLTIIATFLAGQSSKEMTWAQYDRSLASQNQSQAGDQWAFFQAKRTRASNARLSARWTDLVKEPEGFDLQTLPEAAQRLTTDLQAARKEADGLLRQIDESRAELGPETAAGLHAQAQTLRAATDKAAQDADRAQDALDQAFGLSKGGGTPAAEAKPGQGPDRAQLAAAFTYVNAAPPADDSADPCSGVPPFERHQADDPNLEEAVAAVVKHKPDREVQQLALRVDPATLSQAIAAAVDNLDRLDKATSPVNKVLGALDKWVTQQVALARSFSRPATILLAALADAVGTDNPKLAGLRQAAQRVARRTEAIRTSADRLNTAFMAADLANTARRYDCEAHYNREAANLYEVQKHRSSALADRHVDRSKFFFYGMLFAQVGVTISTLALAVRQKSILWTLATVAGLVAVLFGGYLLLDMG
jgi:hypothetical protein